MNSKLYGPSAQVTHSSGFAQWRRGSPSRRHGNPVRMRLPHLVSHRVRIGSRDDVHPELAASRDERPERIALTEPGAAVVERHVGRVVRDDAAGAERCGVGVKTTEVVEPELRIEAAGIVFDKRQLHPTHRSIEPACRCLTWSGRRLRRRLTRAIPVRRGRSPPTRPRRRQRRAGSHDGRGSFAFADCHLSARAMRVSQPKSAGPHSVSRPITLLNADLNSCD